MNSSVLHECCFVIKEKFSSDLQASVQHTLLKRINPFPNFRLQIERV